jgi:hypothetical protein
MPKTLLFYLAAFFLWRRLARRPSVTRRRTSTISRWHRRRAASDFEHGGSGLEMRPKMTGERIDFNFI